MLASTVIAVALIGLTSVVFLAQNHGGIALLVFVSGFAGLFVILAKANKKKS
ncbi:MAG TPA: hypothetical protein VEV41_15220 [Terriglobales bacterium]|nr:hypothetical protein [Terriglobales bacterium]